MRKISIPSFVIILHLLLSLNAGAQATTHTENFDILPATWTNINNSEPKGSSSWFQAYPAIFDLFYFTAHSGDSTSYIAANYLNVDTYGTISTWFISPLLSLANGAEVKFWTRAATGDTFPDRLEVRLSKSGTSTNVGTTATSVGDFTTVLTSINPNLVKGGYPDQEWKEYTIKLSGITGIIDGRIALRYFVTDGGLLGINSNYIGVDDFSYHQTTLGVNFLSFDGALKNNLVQLNWATASELNNKGFNIERSADGRTFSTIAFVEGKGTTSSISNYTYTDITKLPAGKIYYRLRQTDINGAENLSKTIEVNIQPSFKWGVYPNPILKDSWIQLQLAENSTVAVQLVSVNGTILQSVNKGSLLPGTYSVPLNLNNAASGTYFLKLVVNGKTYSQTLVK